MGDRHVTGIAKAGHGFAQPRRRGAGQELRGQSLVEEALARNERPTTANSQREEDRVAVDGV